MCIRDRAYGEQPSQEKKELVLELIPEFVQFCTCALSSPECAARVLPHLALLNIRYRKSVPATPPCMWPGPARTQMRNLMDKAGVLTFCIAYVEKYPEQCLAVLNFMIQGNGSRARKFITLQGGLAVIVSVCSLRMTPPIFQQMTKLVLSLHTDEGMWGTGVAVGGALLTLLDQTALRKPSASSQLSLIHISEPTRPY